MSTFEIPVIDGKDDFQSLLKLDEEIEKTDQMLVNYTKLLDRIIGIFIYNLNNKEIDYCLKNIDPLIY